MRAPVFPRVSDYRIHIVVQEISLILKLFVFLRCDAPVSSTLVLCSYIPIGNRMLVKSSGMAQGLANAPPPGLTKRANASQ